MLKLLEVKNLVASYGDVVVLRGINIKVKKREFVSVIGPNGAGKTTLLRAISGLLKVRQGEIFLKGKRVDNLPPHEIVRIGLAHCPERKRAAPGLTVLENLEVGGYLCKGKEQFKRNLTRVFDLFPVLEQRRKQIAGTLSGGEQQMLNLGRALMSTPKMLTLDEPSLGLAPMLKLKIFEEIKRINEIGVTLLLVEQDVSLALGSSDRLYLLEEGRIHMEGTSNEFTNNDYIRRSYLGV